MVSATVARENAAVTTGSLTSYIGWAASAEAAAAESTVSFSIAGIFDWLVLEERGRAASGVCLVGRAGATTRTALLLLLLLLRAEVEGKGAAAAEPRGERRLIIFCLDSRGERKVALVSR